MELPAAPDPERGGLTVRRILLLALAAFVACRPDSPVAPEREGIQVGGPRFDFTGGTGKVLGSTNQGELVEIDLDAGTVTLIGDAGVFAGDTVLWTDITFDGSGNLFGLSRSFSESDFEVHLYEIDPSTGTIIADIGSAGDHVFSDFDHDGSNFYGNGQEPSPPSSSGGQLFTIDETTAQATWISSDTLGFGLNPYDTIGSMDPIAHGGFAVHPVTGHFWGIEALRSQAPVVYRIDPTTGVADSILRLGIGGVEAPREVGFDALHILDDGTFIATRGGPDIAPDSVLWEINSAPDPVSGLAEIAVIPLTVDPLIVGNLNGLEAIGAQQEPPTFTLTMELADSSDLYPWIREYGPQEAENGTLFQAEVKGDSVGLVVKASFGGTPVDSQEVTITAEFLPRTGGHHHLDDTLSFTDAPDFIGSEWAEDAEDRPVTGSFEYDTIVADSLQVMTDTAGAATLAFRAGFVGGDINIIAATVYDAVPVADTA